MAGESDSQSTACSILPTHSMGRGWNRRFIYIEHGFRVNNAVHALILLKVRMRGGKDARILPQQLLEYFSVEHADEVRMHEVIERWNESSHTHWNSYKGHDGNG